MCVGVPNRIIAAHDHFEFRVDVHPRDRMIPSFLRDASTKDDEENDKKNNNNNTFTLLARANSFADMVVTGEHPSIPTRKRNRSLSDLQVHGGVFRRGPLEYNGCGNFIGTSERSSVKRGDVRCGNCGEMGHITVDCVMMPLEMAIPAGYNSYLQKEMLRSASGVLSDMMYSYKQEDLDGHDMDEKEDKKASAANINILSRSPTSPTSLGLSL
jgi:hypothetical protein